MSISQEKDRSLIICNEYDFKRRINNLLIEAAYPAEKYTVSTPKAAIDKFNEHKEIVNVIINGADFKDKRVFLILAEIGPIFKERDHVKVLVFLTEEQTIMLNSLDKKPDFFKFSPLPITLKKVNEVLNPISYNKGAPKKKIHNIKEKPKEPPKPQKNLNFYETSQHIKDTLDSLKALGQDRKDMAAIQHIGQRFNGIFGAFSFVEDKKGYKELLQLSHIIDDIARHYAKEDAKKEIENPHYELLLDAAKCSYLLLKQLRDNLPIEKTHLDAYEKVTKDREKCPEVAVYKAAKQSQEEIDEMLKALG